MHHPFYLLIPFALAAARSLAIEIAPPRVPFPAILAETEYRVLVGVAFALTMLLIVSSLMNSHPELGAIIAAYNQF